MFLQKHYYNNKKLYREHDYYMIIYCIFNNMCVFQNITLKLIIILLMMLFYYNKLYLFLSIKYSFFSVLDILIFFFRAKNNVFT